jgi:hypothetical protein
MAIGGAAFGAEVVSGARGIVRVLFEGQYQSVHIQEINFQEGFSITRTAGRLNVTALGGGGGGVSLPVSSTTAIVRDSTDSTKRLRFDVASVGTGQTRVISMPNANVDLANVPSSSEKAALAGTSGTPGGSNRFVTNGDSRLSDARDPNAHAVSHELGGSDALTLDASQVSGLASIATTGSASDLGSGTVGYARLPVGTTANTVAAGDDSRMTNARTPTAHASSHLTGGGDAIQLATSSQPGLMSTAFASILEDPPFLASVGDDGVTQTVQPRLNLVSGAQMNVSCANNAGTESTDCTFAATAPGSDGQLVRNTSGAFGAVSTTGAVPGMALRLSSASAPGWTTLASNDLLAQWVEDWLSATGQLVWTSANSGTGAQSGLGAALTDTNHPGVVSLQTGTTNTGLATLSVGGAGIKVDAANQYIYVSAIVYIGALSTAGDRYTFTTGLGSGATAGAPQNGSGLWMEYNDANNSGAMRCCAGAAGAMTCTSGGTAAVATTWVKWELIVSGGVLTCYRNGTQHGSTINSGFPSTTAGLSNIVKVEKSAGTTNMTVSIDRFASALRTTR